MTTDQTLLEVRDLEVAFPQPTRIGRRRPPALRAVRGVSFEIRAGSSLALVGESGSGKSTIARTVVGLQEPSGGTIVLEGRERAELDKREKFLWRKEAQMIFQDPYSSLNPRLTVAQSVMEGLRSFGIGRKDSWKEVVDGALEEVGLRASWSSRYPHQLSGGQRQRVVIARALAVSPRLLVADEPVSALDVSVQAQVLNLLKRLRRDRGLSYLFISHDLSVVRIIADEVAVVYFGRIVERGSRDQIFDRPRHPYTRTLLASTPDPSRIKTTATNRTLLPFGETPSLLSPPSGCTYRTRCPFATQLCAEVEPQLEETDDGQLVACHRWKEVSDGRRAAAPGR